MVRRCYYLLKYGTQHMAGCCGGNRLLATAHWSVYRIKTFNVTYNNVCHQALELKHIPSVSL
jgi:hypothetical protein